MGRYPVSQENEISACPYRMTGVTPSPADAFNWRASGIKQNLCLDGGLEIACCVFGTLTPWRCGWYD